MTNNNDSRIHLDKHKNHELDIALISLNIGIQAYFSTYQSIKGFLEIVATLPSKGLFDFDEQYNLFEKIHIENYRKSKTSYIRSYIETIFHFHHFTEISIKEILRKEHELLPSIAGRKHIILHKLLKGDEIADEERAQLNTLEFGEAKDR